MEENKKSLALTDSDKPETKVAKMLTGEDYRKDLKTTLELEKLLYESGKSGITPKRPKVFRLADSIIKKLNELDDTAEKNPDSDEAAHLDQLHNLFGRKCY